MPLYCPSPIFIIGCLRTGKTLTASILNKHPDIFIQYELNLFHFLYRHWFALTRKREGRSPKQIFIDITCHYLKYKNIKAGISRRDIANMINELADESWGSLLDAYMRLLMLREKPIAKRWGEKSPVHSGSLEHIQKSFPEAQFIYCYRDPRDAVASMVLKEYNVATNDIFFGSAIYNQIVEQYNMQKSRINSCKIYELCYEKLVSNSQEVIEQVCDFLNVPYMPSLLLPADDKIRLIIGWETSDAWEEITHQEPPKGPFHDRIIETITEKWLLYYQYPLKRRPFKGFYRIICFFYLIPFFVLYSFFNFLWHLKYPEFVFYLSKMPDIKHLAFSGA